MAVVSWREVVGRSFSHQFGQKPSAERKFVVTIDSPDTPSQEIIAAVGIGHLDPHPEFPFVLMTNATVTDGTPSPFHAELTYTYEKPDKGQDIKNPLNRPDIWSFSTSGAAIPAYYYFDQANNNTSVAVLQNTAKDFFEGAMTDEAELRVSIQSNRPTFPVGLATSVTNCINSDAFLSSLPFQWKCAGISANQTTEVIDVPDGEGGSTPTEVTYWQVTSELVYRQTGWELQLPNVGYHCIENGKKIRAYVFDPEDRDKGIFTRIACASPVALEDDGSIKPEGVAPTILRRRVHRAVDFIPLFGIGPV